MLNKANFHSADICRLIKVNNVKEDQGEKLIQTFIFHKLPSAQEI